MYHVLLLLKVPFVDTLKVLEVMWWVFFSFGLSLFKECVWRVIIVMACDRKAGQFEELVLLGTVVSSVQFGLC